jgi:hypothetical protein
VANKSTNVSGTAKWLHHSRGKLKTIRLWIQAQDTTFSYLVQATALHSCLDANCNSQTHSIVQSSSNKQNGTIQNPVLKVKVKFVAVFN